jgi:hypothetical protein
MQPHPQMSGEVGVVMTILAKNTEILDPPLPVPIEFCKQLLATFLV